MKAVAASDIVAGYAVGLAAFGVADPGLFAIDIVNLDLVRLVDDIAAGRVARRV